MTKPILEFIRQAQWRWDFSVASHGAAFHAPQEIQRILSHGIERAMQARLANAKILARLGFTGDVPMPDISTKDKAQKYIGLDIPAERKKQGQIHERNCARMAEKSKSRKQNHCCQIN